jgi:hypothetical protein
MISCASPIFSNLLSGIIEHVPINLGHQLRIPKLLQALLSNRFGPQHKDFLAQALWYGHTLADLALASLSN